MEGTDDSSHLTEKMTTVELIRYKDQLEALKSALQAAVASSQEKVSLEEKDNLDSRILELQQELFRLTSFKSAQSLALQRLQMGGSLQEVLFQNDAPIDQGERQRIKSLVDQQRKLATEILAHQRHCEELRREQEIVQSERRDVTQQSRLLMKQLKELQENEYQSDKDSHKRLREEIERSEGHLSIARNVLQGLIVGSGVHWADDPKLQELLLSLGDKIS